MSDRWWRAYDRSRRDPKLQRLPAETFRGWYNLVCLASENGGTLPALDVIAFEIRKKPEVVSHLLQVLKAAELFEQVDGKWTPRKWNTLQYKSDVSSNRVKQFRERRRNVSETPSETEADTERKGSPYRATPSDNETPSPTAARERPQGAAHDSVQTRQVLQNFTGKLRAS